jgi:hypothetical protein
MGWPFNPAKMHMAESGSATTGNPRRPSSPWRDLAKVAMFLLVVGSAILLWTWSERPEQTTPSRPPLSAGKRDLGGGYVGNQSCRDCHPGEYAAHGRSGHNRTLRPAGSGPEARRLDGRRFPDPGEPDIAWSYAVRDGRLAATRSRGGVMDAPIPLDYALGSGQHATTFVTLTGEDTGRRGGLEHRLTYFAHSGSLGLTPGQPKASASGPSPYGWVLTLRQLQDCFDCHATRTSAGPSGPLDVTAMIPNVSCERCHGPGQSHVDKARAGSPAEDLAMILGPDGDALSEVRSCGKCHRLPDQFHPRELRPENAVLARFPSVGLLQSKCYVESRGGMRCATCHDPHARVSHEATAYQETCLSCHRAAPQATCPASPSSGCIECHMPKRDVGRGLRFTDHWIRFPAGRSP